jgi:hypothetical protein
MLAAALLLSSYMCLQVEFDRVAEAQRAGIHSTLLLTMYDLAGSSSSHCAVFELAQHEEDQDFMHAVNILNSVCQVSCTDDRVIELRVVCSHVTLASVE